MTLKELQERIKVWAIEKGWFDPLILDWCAPVNDAQIKLAKLALAHTSLDELAEKVRKDPKTDIGHYEQINLAPVVEASAETRNCNAIAVFAKLALINTEVAEALDAIIGSGSASYFSPEEANQASPEGKPEGFGSELADVVIRCFQLAGDLDVDLESEILLKLRYNDGRPTKHGKHA